MLNGLINPDEGKIEMHGRVAALIELGAGFNPILTGRENIYNNGTILGLTRQEIESVIEEIIDFAEIRDFIDTPVQNYSSGMKVRLGFAIASQMKPDVLIIDEVLAVGDTGFKIKCFNRIAELKENCAVIFVSHSMPQVSRICNKAIFMVKGQMKYEGDNLTEAIEGYYNSFENTDLLKEKEFKNIELNNLIIQNQMRESSISHGDDLVFLFSLNKKNQIQTSSIEIRIVDKDYKIIANSFATLQNELEMGNTDICITIPKIQLGIGTYFVNIGYYSKLKDTERGVMHEYHQNIASFKIVSSPIVALAAFQLTNAIKVIS